MCCCWIGERAPAESYPDEDELRSHLQLSGMCIDIPSPCCRLLLAGQRGRCTRVHGLCLLQVMPVCVWIGIKIGEMQSFSKTKEKFRLFFAISLIDGQSIGKLDTECCLISLRVNLPQSARILRSHAKVRRDLPVFKLFWYTFLHVQKRH